MYAGRLAANFALEDFRINIRLSMKKTAIVLFAIGICVVAVIVFYDYLVVDKCLDGGGVWKSGVCRMK